LSVEVSFVALVASVAAPARILHLAQGDMLDAPRRRLQPTLTRRLHILAIDWNANMHIGQAESCTVLIPSQCSNAVPAGPSCCPPASVSSDPAHYDAVPVSMI